MFRISLNLAIVVFFTSIASTAIGQLICGLGDFNHDCNGLCQLEAIAEDQFTSIPPPEDFVFGEQRVLTTVINYTAFDPTAQAAFEYALDIWASTLDSPVTVQINAVFGSLGTNVLAAAGPAAWQRNFLGAPLVNTWYPVGLANAIAGQDILNGVVDVNVYFNPNFNWYYGLDANPPAGSYDFVTVALHELGHALGFVGMSNYNVGTGAGFIGLDGFTSIYDFYTELGDGTDILSIPAGTVQLGDAFTSNDLYWSGAAATANNGGNQPRLYAPATYNSGSSYSHLNEVTYGSGSINSLMTPQLGSAEANHDPGPITYGMFEDIGWSVGPCSIDAVTVGTQFACNPLDNTYTQQITVTYGNAPSNGSLVVNGVNYPIFSSPQLISLTGLPSDGLSVDLDVSFSLYNSCQVTMEDAFSAPASCCANLRLLEVNPVAGSVTLRNFGSCEVDVSDYVLSASLTEATLGSLSLLSGDLSLAEDETVTLEWTHLATVASASDLALYNPEPDLNSVLDIIDFVQWGSGNNGRAVVADNAGFWSANAALDANKILTYFATGAEYGPFFWNETDLPCVINSLTAGFQTECLEESNAYTQLVSFTFTSPPATGDLIINGLTYPYNGELTKNYFLVGLSADGLPVDVTAYFEDDSTCSISAPALFVAPPACLNTCPSDLSGDDETTIADLLLLLAEFGCNVDCVYDIDGDGTIGSADILIVVSNIGTICP